MKSVIIYILKVFSINALIVHFISYVLYNPVFKDEQWRCMETDELVAQLIFGIIVIAPSLRIYWEVLNDEPTFK